MDEPIEPPDPNDEGGDAVRHDTPSGPVWIKADGTSTDVDPALPTAATATSAAATPDASTPANPIPTTAVKPAAPLGAKPEAISDDDLLETIHEQESPSRVYGNGYTARNQDTTAAGKYQFLKKTARDLAAAKNPDGSDRYELAPFAREHLLGPLTDPSSKERDEEYKDFITAHPGVQEQLARAKLDDAKRSHKVKTAANPIEAARQVFTDWNFGPNTDMTDDTPYDKNNSTRKQRADAFDSARTRAMNMRGALASAGDASDAQSLNAAPEAAPEKTNIEMAQERADAPPPAGMAPGARVGGSPALAEHEAAIGEKPTEPSVGIMDVLGVKPGGWLANALKPNIPPEQARAQAQANLDAFKKGNDPNLVEQAKRMMQIAGYGDETIKSAVATGKVPDRLDPGVAAAAGAAAAGGTGAVAAGKPTRVIPGDGVKPIAPPASSAAAAPDPETAAYDEAMNNLKADRASLLGWSRGREASLDAMRADVAAGKINPDRLMASKGTAARIFAAIAVAAGEYASKVDGGPNTAHQIIQGAIDADIEAQRAALGQKTTAYSMALQQYGDALHARAAATQIDWDIARTLHMEHQQGLRTNNAIATKTAVEKGQMQQAQGYVDAIEKSFLKNIGNGTVNAIEAGIAKHSPDDNPFFTPKTKLYMDDLATNAELFMKSIPGIRHTPENVIRIQKLFPQPGLASDRNANRRRAMAEAIRVGALTTLAIQGGALPAEPGHEDDPEEAAPR